MLKKSALPSLEFFKIFYKNSGAWVAAAMVLSKLSFFLLNIFIARNLLKSELGIATQAQNFLGFFVPFAGLGSYQGLLKFGSKISDESERQTLAEYSLYYGILGQFAVTVIMMLLGTFLYHEQLSLLAIIGLFSIRFFGLFLIEIYKASARGGFDNRNFSKMELAVSLATLFSTLVCVEFFGLKGYIFALCISPFSILFFGLKNIRLKPKFIQMPEKHFWDFNIFTAFASLLHELFYLSDVFLVGILLSQSAVAEYKTAALIPLNFLLFSRIFIQADYPKLCRHHEDGQFLRRYSAQFLTIFLPASALVLLLCGFFSNQIITIFGSQYSGTSSLFVIFLCAAFFGACFRVPFSNMLFALGKTRQHIYISLVSVAALFVLILLNYDSGIRSVAVSYSIATAFSGILYFLYFRFELKKLTRNT